MVQMSNNYQTFILYGKNSGTTYYSYTIDAGTKTIKTIHTSKYNSFVSSNSSPYVFYFSSNLFYMICQHVLTNETKTLSLDKNGIESMAFLPSGDGLPQVFTSLLSIISAADNSIYKFDYPYNGYNIQSSHDGKLLLVSYNKMEYLFASDALTFFLKNLK
jgi:WD40 repeat protein